MAAFPCFPYHVVLYPYLCTCMQRNWLPCNAAWGASRDNQASAIEALLMSNLMCPLAFSTYHPLAQAFSLLKL